MEAGQEQRRKDNVDANSAMKWEKDIELIENVLGRHLSLVQHEIVLGVLEDKTYKEIADSTSYSRGYINQEASVIFKKLSEKIQRRVSKKSFRYLITRRRAILEAWTIIYNERETGQ